MEELEDDISLDLAEPAEAAPAGRKLSRLKRAAEARSPQAGGSLPAGELEALKEPTADTAKGGAGSGELQGSVKGTSPDSAACGSAVSPAFKSNGGRIGEGEEAREDYWDEEDELQKFIQQHPRSHSGSASGSEGGSPAGLETYMICVSLSCQLHGGKHCSFSCLFSSFC